MGEQARTIDYVRPREKARQKGIAALSDRELIQLIIGSGTVKHSVARISKRVVGLLHKHGSRVGHEHLIAVPGLGVARTAQLLASFELAGRYPVPSVSRLLDTPEALADQIRSTPDERDRLWLLTLDGAKRLLSQRPLVRTEPTITLLRDIASNMIKDNATHLALLRYASKGKAVPDMQDLVIARDIYRISLLLGIQSVDYLICSDDEQHSIMKEASYAA